MLFGKEPHWFANHGATATGREIHQQGDCWQKIPALLAATDPALKSRLHAALHDARATIAFSGAGTSAYVGDILAPAIQRHSRAHCLATASTDLVAQPAGKLPRDAHGFLFAFARSGNSPESVASLEKAAAVAPELVPVAVTCNDRGALAEHCRNGHGYCCQMPPETHDESFVMTSSFSTMTLFTAALCREALDLPPPDFAALAAAQRRISDTFYTSTALDALAACNRIIYLGSDALYGAARESALKILEMTAGKIPTMAETTLGFRHGPKSLINGETAVCFFVSGDPYTQQYDRDLALEVLGDGNAAQVLIFAPAAFTVRYPELAASRAHVITFDAALDGEDDAALAPLYVQYAQLSGLRCALDAGISPDNPSPDGSVNRVVKGVTDYPYPV
ncbi:Galactosamine-6-phosphate isomerase [Cardiobacterium hominis]|uniref:Galactosamine-6-phosphate isomerase n=1 Tax=Cardiobacterium hominis TaxID=2718 RepID=A0A1C3HNY4_9GAMM|nr:SIS domain-containing protein [Cardiobacterium hominis]SAY70368.1 Galactosamine-6-phosphate isomerase [Cardiobacterium hominis]